MGKSSKITATLLVLAVVAAVAGFASVKLRKPPIPVHLADTLAVPQDIVNVGDSWYWIERPAKGKARLVRTPESTESSQTVLASADEIVGFDVSGSSIAWTSRNGEAWTINSGPITGPQSTVWTGADIVGRPIFSGSELLWTRVSPGLVKEGDAMPGLGPSVDVIAKHAQEPERKLCNIAAGWGSMVSSHGNAASLIVRPSERSFMSTIIEVSLKDGSTRRLAGELNMESTLGLQDGTLIWVGMSQDSSGPSPIACIRAVGTDGAVRTRGDWLPSAGRLYVVGTDIYYVDGAANPSIWPIKSNEQLVRPLPQSPRVYPLAIGEREILFASGEKFRGEHVSQTPR